MEWFHSKGVMDDMARIINQDISIGENLRRLRVRAGLTQEQAAARIQVKGIPMSREIISQMERGAHNINVSVLIAMKEIYRASFDEFFLDL